jgi:ribonuclease BN (tRNA processing enzyme)
VVPVALPAIKPDQASIPEAAPKLLRCSSGKQALNLPGGQGDYGTDTEILIGWYAHTERSYVSEPPARLAPGQQKRAAHEDKRAMKITWNGVGAAWAPHFGNSSAVIEAGATRLLIDCGHSVPARLHRIDLTLGDLDAVFISHLHGDHVYGLEEWGFRNHLHWNRRPPLFIAEELADPLWRQVLSGTMGQLAGSARTMADYFTVVPMLPGEPHTVGPLRVMIHPVLHVPNAPAYGIRIDHGAARAAFTCDTVAPVNPWFYDGAAVVFHDCSFNPVYPGTVHSHFDQILKYPEEYRRKTSLVHFDDSVCQRDSSWRMAVEATGMRITSPFLPVSLDPCEDID